ncbi:tyrosyl-DNA phosphodiesterase 2-like [Aplochiton taeniatus]
MILKTVLKPYHVLPGGDEGYFTAILLRKTRVQLLGFDIMNFPETKMSRNLLTVNVLFAGYPLCLMTSHLESMKNNFQVRVNQVLQVWKRMSEQPSDCNVIFGGDTNLRDNEVVKTLGGLPDEIRDVWECLGMPEECHYTWDLTTNDNKVLPFPARLRFDRLFLRQAWEGSKVTPAGMTLVGMERLHCGRFTSDHWGIFCTFNMEPRIGEAREFGIIPGRPVPTAEWVHLKVIKRKWSEPRWTGPWKVRERTEHAIRLEGKGEAWYHWSQCAEALAQSRSLGALPESKDQASNHTQEKRERRSAPGEDKFITATIEKPGPPPAYQMPLLGAPDQDSDEGDQDLEDDDV